MEIKVSQTINKPIAEVWEVMGNQFGHAHKWSSNFKSSKPGGTEKFKGLAYSLRDTETDRGNTIQELTEFDALNHSLTYVITKGAPDIAKQAGATWTLIQQSENITSLAMNFNLEPKMELPKEMEDKIKMGLTSSVQELAAELKYYLENGKAQLNK